MHTTTTGPAGQSYLTLLTTTTDLLSLDAMPALPPGHLPRDNIC